MMKKNRIGEKRIASCGMEMEIIAYRNYNDIDIRFADGTVIIHKQYSNFCKGYIAYPGFYKNKYTGETDTYKDLQIEIIEYRNAGDVDIKFSNGYILKHTEYASFKKKSFPLSAFRYHEEKIASNGMKMKIIEYRSNKDIDIEFEDGMVVTHKNYRDFCLGHIKYPIFYEEERMGEISTYKDLQMEIIAYRKANDIDVKFSNGFILEHTAYTNFKRKAFPFSVSHYHEKKIASNGMEMTIIECRSSKDIDIQLEDGAIIHHKTYGYFCKGNINTTPKQQAETRIGEKKTANCGLEMEIIAYRKYNDIDVKFPDGEIKEHVSYDSFTSGTIRPQSYSRIGQTVKCNNGMSIQLLEYHNASDVDVMFEDGARRTHMAMSEFRKGRIKHPAFNSNYTSNNFHSVQMAKGFRGENGAYYYICTFPDGVKDICTPQQVMERVGIKPVF